MTHPTNPDATPCPSCFEGFLKDIIQNHVSCLPDGTEVKVTDVVSRVCSACGEKFFPPESSARIEAAVLKSQGVFSAKEVQAMVAMTGLSEEALCEKLGLGARTIYRWRCGAQRPSKSLGILLAAVAHHPELLEWVEIEGWKQGETSTTAPSKSLKVGVALKPTGIFIQTPRVSRRGQLGLTRTRGISTRLPGVPSRSMCNPVSSFFQFAGTLSHV